MYSRGKSIHVHKELEMATGLLFWARPGPWFLEKARPGPARPVKYICSAAPPGFRFGGNILGGRHRRGSGGRSPPDARKFWKFPKNFSRKLQKTIFQKNKEPCVKFSRFERKNQLCGEFLRKLSKISLKIAQRMPCFGLFSKKFQNPAINFRAFKRKT